MLLLMMQIFTRGRRESNAVRRPRHQRARCRRAATSKSAVGNHQPDKRGVRTIAAAGRCSHVCGTSTQAPPTATTTCGTSAQASPTAITTDSEGRGLKEASSKLQTSRCWRFFVLFECDKLRPPQHRPAGCLGPMLLHAAPRTF